MIPPTVSKTTNETPNREGEPGTPARFDSGRKHQGQTPASVQKPPMHSTMGDADHFQQMDATPSPPYTSRNDGYHHDYYDLSAADLARPQDRNGNGNSNKGGGDKAQGSRSLRRFWGSEEQFLSRVNAPDTALLFSHRKSIGFFAFYVCIVILIVLCIIPLAAPLASLRLVLYGDGTGANAGTTLEQYYLWSTGYAAGAWGPLVKKKLVMPGTGLSIVLSEGISPSQTAGQVGLFVCLVLALGLIPLPALAYVFVKRMNVHTSMRKRESQDARQGSPSSSGGEGNYPLQGSQQLSYHETSMLNSHYATPRKGSGNTSAGTSGHSYEFASVTKPGVEQVEMTSRRPSGAAPSPNHGGSSPPLPLKNGEPETMAAGGRKLFHITEEEDGELNEVSFQPSTREQTRRAARDVQQHHDMVASMAAARAHERYVITVKEQKALRQLRGVAIAHLVLVSLAVLFALVAMAGIAAYYNSSVKETFVEYKGQATQVGPGLGAAIALFLFALVSLLLSVLPSAWILRGTRVLLHKAEAVDTNASRAHLYRDDREAPATAADTTPRKSGPSALPADRSTAPPMESVQKPRPSTDPDVRPTTAAARRPPPREGSVTHSSPHDSRDKGFMVAAAGTTFQDRPGKLDPSLVRPYDDAADEGEEHHKPFGEAHRGGAASKPVAASPTSATGSSGSGNGSRRASAVYGYPVALPGPPVSELDPEPLPQSAFNASVASGERIYGTSSYTPAVPPSSSAPAAAASTAGPSQGTAARAAQQGSSEDVFSPVSGPYAGSDSASAAARHATAPAADDTLSLSMASNQQPRTVYVAPATSDFSPSGRVAAAPPPDESEEATDAHNLSTHRAFDDE